MTEKATHRMLRGQVYLRVNDVTQEVKKDAQVTLSPEQAKSFEASGWAVRITRDATPQTEAQIEAAKRAAKAKKKREAAAAENAAEKDDPKKDSK